MFFLLLFCLYMYYTFILRTLIIKTMYMLPVRSIYIIVCTCMALGQCRVTYKLLGLCVVVWKYCLWIILVHVESFGFAVLYGTNNIPLLKSVYWCQFKWYSFTFVVFLNSIRPLCLSRCNQPIVCCLYLGCECMGWSDLTKLPEVWYENCIACIRAHFR